MKPGIFQQIILYRYRYVVGYSLFVLFGVAMLVWQLSDLGPGLASAEKTSAVQSANWQWQNWKEAGLQVVNLPYVLLQKASISVFGLSTLSVRLPSALLGLATSALFFLLMRQMHRSHVALATSVLFAASSWYVAVGHFGTALIMIPFIWTLVTYAFVRLTRLDDPPLAWAALGGLAGAAALYTPYGIYALITALLIIAIHPALRRSVTGLSGQQVVLALFIVVPLLLPFGWGIYKDYEQLWPLFGLTSQFPTATEFLHNVSEVFLALSIHAPHLPELRLSDIPLFSIGASALLLAGLGRMLLDWRSIRTQFTILGLLILLIVIGLNPQHKDYTVLILPLYLLLASGVTVLFSEWYRLFPRNPYARSFGLIPIVIFLSFLVVYHYQRYFVAWANAPRTYQVYDNDLTLVRTQLKEHPNLTLITTPEDAPLYKVLARHHSQMVLNPTTSQPDKPQLISSAVATPTAVPNVAITPVVNDDSKESLRFWLVTPNR